ncbi:MAG: lamin tail domain-containing protein, partial [Bacteroidota bacterium]
DGLVAYFPFTGGPEPDFTVSVSGGATVGGDDPAAENGGTVIVSGLIEGGFYQVTFGGGGCATEMFTVPVPTGLCSPPALVINEVLADPTNSSDPTANDTNGNGAVNSGDEFVEIINVTDTDIDVSGYTVGDDTGPRYTFPVGTIIPAFSGFVVIGDPVGNSLSCATNATLLGTGTGFIGLSNAGDIIDLRTSSGVLVHNMSYGSEGGLGESLALNPDGNIVGGYVLHTTIATNPVTSSPCEENPNAGVSLPVELLSFNAEAAPKQVNLTWITTNEVANDRFEVQRSLDGQDWSTIGEVAAAPHTGRSTENTYRFSDQAPLVGDNYYRLAQIDLDGTRTLYGPVRAYFSSRVGLGLYPNPVTNTLNLTQLLEVTDRLQLLGADGRLLRELPVASAAIEVADLQPGVYLLRVEGAVEVSVLRFVKQ